MGKEILRRTLRWSTGFVRRLRIELNGRARGVCPPGLEAGTITRSLSGAYLERVAEYPRIRGRGSWGSRGPRNQAPR